MIRRPPRSTLDRSSAASDVYKRQVDDRCLCAGPDVVSGTHGAVAAAGRPFGDAGADPVSYTHLRAHETVLALVCRLLLEKNTSELQTSPPTS